MLKTIVLKQEKQGYGIDEEMKLYTFNARNDIIIEAIAVTVWVPWVQLRCETNNISLPVEMSPDTRAQLFMACLCYNSKENTIKIHRQ